MATSSQPTPLPFSRTTGPVPRGTAEVESLATRRWYRSHDRLRQLSRAELDDLVADLAGRPDLWRAHVRHLEDERYYVRLLLTEHVEIWLICWAILVSALSSTTVNGRMSDVADSSMMGESAGLTLRQVGGLGRFLESWPEAALIAACTSLAAPSMLRSRSNCTVM